MLNEKRPLRIIRAATPRSNGHATVWGLTLDCGHYVERADVARSDNHPRARCDDCVKGTKPLAALLTVCTMCNLTSDGYGVPGCGSCYGFGRFEKLIHLAELLTGPKPGSAEGDHILGLWLANLDGALLTTTIAKRGRSYIGEHMRASVGLVPNVVVKPNPATTIKHMGNGITAIHDRFFPTNNLSQELLIQNTENMVAEAFDSQLHDEGLFRRVFVELRTTDRCRALGLGEQMMNQLMEAE